MVPFFFNMSRSYWTVRLLFALLMLHATLFIPVTTASASTVKFLGLTPLKTITTEEAVSPAEVAKGLMYRATLPEEQGMIFIFKKDKPLYFWMKNVIINLDIIFLDKDLVIRKIHHVATPCNKPPCKIYKSGFPARYALEVSGGFCKKYGVKELQRIEYRQ